MIADQPVQTPLKTEVPPISAERRSEFEADSLEVREGQDRDGQAQHRRVAQRLWTVSISCSDRIRHVLGTPERNLLTARQKGQLRT
jgi:hypothetical protein